MDLYGVLSDLVCVKCIHILGMAHVPAKVVYCDGCKTLKTKKDFCDEALTRWMMRNADFDIFCKRCKAGAGHSGRERVSPEKRRCCGRGCSSDHGQQSWTAVHFLQADWTDAENSGETAKCARCKVLEDPVMSQLEFPCDGCGGQKKKLTEFSAVICKDHLLERRHGNKRCFECQYPQCCIPGCSLRPEVAVASNHVDQDGQWICHWHRYPPCCVCNVTPRPLSAISGKIKFREWTCEECQAKPPGPSEAEAAAKSMQMPVCMCGGYSWKLLNA